MVGCVRYLVFHADPAKKSAESAAMVKLKGEELARGSVTSVDGDGEDGSLRRQRKRL